MLLRGKTAIVYGGDRPAGSAVARAFAREQAQVFLTGRSHHHLEEVAAVIRAAGGTVHTAEIDLLDQAAVEAHANAVADAAQAIDIAIYAAASDRARDLPLTGMECQDVVHDVTSVLTAGFHAAVAAARHMTRGHGVIVVVASTNDIIPNQGSTHVACATLAGLYQQLGCELAPDGIRVLWLQAPPADGTPGAGPVVTALAGELPGLDDIANVAAALASDVAGAFLEPWRLS
jgi:3-oxoacyl-[acyl-carrier protein] reductase